MKVKEEGFSPHFLSISQNFFFIFSFFCSIFLKNTPLLADVSFSSNSNSHEKIEHPQPLINHIHLVGERASGTNFIASLLKNNIENITVTEQKEITPYGWKHGFLDDKQLINKDHCLYVHVYRNIYDFLRSFYKKPWHTHSSLRNISFSEWIRKEWQCTYDVLFFNSKKYTSYQHLLGTEILFERDPRTGKRFENVIQLRTSKLTHFEELKSRVKHFFSLPYEIANEDPKKFLHQFAHKFSLKLKHNFTPILSNKGWNITKYTKIIYDPFLEEDLNFINNQADWNLETLLGYEKNIFDVCKKNIFLD